MKKLLVSCWSIPFVFLLASPPIPYEDVWEHLALVLPNAAQETVVAYVNALK